MSFVKSNESLQKKVIPSEEYIIQQRVVQEFKIRKAKSTKRKFVPRKKIWKV